MQSFDYWWNRYRNQGAKGMQEMLRGAMGERDQEIGDLRLQLKFALNEVRSLTSVSTPPAAVTDFSRPPDPCPSLSGGVQMPGQMGAADGLPSDDPANQQSLAMQEAELRTAEYGASALPPAANQ